MDKPKKGTMDVMMNMQRDAWRERQPPVTRPVDETTPLYDVADIYDYPAPYMTIRGVFRYVGIEVISW